MPAGLWIRLICTLVGAGLLASVLSSIDLTHVTKLIGDLEWRFLFVLFAAALAFTADVVSWLAVLPGLPFNFRHGLLLWKVRLVGEMLNTVTPVAGVGGEPVKAWILVRRFGLAPRETIASVLVAKTTILLSYIPFLAIGFALMFGTVALPGDYVGIAGAGLAIYTIAIVAFFLVQRYRLVSRLGTRLCCFRFGEHLDGLLRRVRDIENELEHLYVVAPRRLWCSLGLAFLGWILGAVELFVISAVLGCPMSPMAIWSIEAVVQLLRQATGFIPGSLGVTEGMMMLMYGSLAGDPSAGVAVALIRRLREVVWIMGGLIFGLGYLNSRYRSLASDPHREAGRERDAHLVQEGKRCR
jgi:glycosyltransferase 2 family protein